MTDHIPQSVGRAFREWNPYFSPSIAQPTFQQRLEAGEAPKVERQPILPLYETKQHRRLARPRGG